MKYNFHIDMNLYTSTTLILQNITAGSKVLEFGPALGYMTRYMKETLNCLVTCVEVDPVAAEFAKPFCEKMLVGDLEMMQWAVQLKGEEFDHIVFADVLEHLKNPVNALLNASRFLKKTGTILTSIPNIGHSAIIMDLLQGKFQYRPLGLLDETHIRFFTRSSINDLFEKTGLQSIKEFQIELPPERTEIAQNYLNFPESIRGVLENRADAHVYQFVNIVQKKGKDIKD